MIMTFQVKTFERKPGHCMTGNNIQYEFFQIKPEILNAKNYYKYRLVLCLNIDIHLESKSFRRSAFHISDTVSFIGNA